MMLNITDHQGKANQNHDEILPHNFQNGCYKKWHFPDGSEYACSAGDPNWILGQEDHLEKEMATHSSILACKIPWMEEPGRLQSMGSQRVGHD